ncbi:hypothetical protein FRC16_009011 [Serendipita sp. 398]|nr:hypothetical protein FRC16_009011 [Serendipita sp. 398]
MSNNLLIEVLSLPSNAENLPKSRAGQKISVRYVSLPGLLQRSPLTNDLLPLFALVNICMTILPPNLNALCPIFQPTVSLGCSSMRDSPLMILISLPSGNLDNDRIYRNCRA